jgi:hypothetical protein
VPGEGEQVQRGQRYRQKCFAVAEINWPIAETPASGRGGGFLG